MKSSANMWQNRINPSKIRPKRQKEVGLSGHMVRVGAIGFRVFEVLRLFGFRSYARYFAIIGACTILASCSSLTGGKELTTYDLSAPDSFSNLRGRTNAQILVAVPTALKSLDSEMIVVRPGGSEITYFGDAQWSDRLPRVVQEKLVQTFENSHRVRSVAKPGDGVVVDYKIVTSIRAFELSDEAGASAHVALSVKIINDRNGRVRASKQFNATSPANLSNSQKGVEAIDRAMDVVLRDILVWVLDTI